MSGVGNNRSAAGKITGQSLPGRQAEVGGESQPENVLGLLAGFIAAAAVVRVADMPPLRNLVVRAVCGVEGVVIVELGRTEGLNDAVVRVEMEVLVAALGVESGEEGFVNGIEILEFEEIHSFV